MKNYAKRVLFGEELQMSQAGLETCSECGCARGSAHRPGCSAEECEWCGKSLIGCHCEALSPHDGEQIILGLYKQFPSLDAALNAVSINNENSGASYLQHAVMRYIFDHVPESARSEITKAFHIRFPGLVPKLQDDEGRGYYTAEQLAKALGISESEVNERIDAMVTASNSIPFSGGKKLRKVH